MPDVVGSYRALPKMGETCAVPAADCMAFLLSSSTQASHFDRCIQALLGMAVLGALRITLRRLGKIGP